jgi:hypothetical protein
MDITKFTALKFGTVEKLVVDEPNLMQGLAPMLGMPRSCNNIIMGGAEVLDIPTLSVIFTVINLVVGICPDVINDATLHEPLYNPGVIFSVNVNNPVPPHAVALIFLKLATTGAIPEDASVALTIIFTTPLDGE